MNLFVINEAIGSSTLASLEQRCAATPATVKKLCNLGCTVAIEAGAGLRAGYSDGDYTTSGAEVVSRQQGIANAQVVLYVNRPNDEDLTSLQPSTLVIGHLDPFFQQPLIRQLANSKATALSIEMIPRSTRAQKMDALSSQASLAGYVMVLQAAMALPSIFPMMMTPSGSIKPAKVFVIGAGVAGLQAIATARRLGASVTAYDTRAVVAEQVESLGAKFLSIDLGETGQTKDGYAKALTEEQQKIQKNAQKDAIADADIVITTAQLFGRKPPQLIDKTTLALMKPNSVVVDMAAQSGGNVEGSVAGETVDIEGVRVIGTGNWSQQVAKDATDMYANNCFNLIEEFFDAESDSIPIDLSDDILAQSVVTCDGHVCNPILIKHYGGTN